MSKAQNLADKIARNFHKMHDIKDETIAEAEAIEDGGNGVAMVKAMFETIEAAMSVGRIACSELGLNEGGK